MKRVSQVLLPHFFIYLGNIKIWDFMTNEEFISSIKVDGEIWSTVVGLEDYYMVSTEGRVVSLSRQKRTVHGTFYWTKPKLLKQTIGYSNGIPYYRVSLADKNGEQKKFTVHRLEMLTFVPNPNNFSDVDHINRNSLDNRIVNLRWCTRKMNMENENTRKILAICHKDADKSYRWRPVVRLKDGTEVKRYRSITEATKDGFDGCNITHVCRGEKKTHRGYQWVYLDEYDKSISSSTSPE